MPQLAPGRVRLLPRDAGLARSKALELALGDVAPRLEAPRARERLGGGAAAGGAASPEPDLEAHEQRDGAATD